MTFTEEEFARYLRLQFYVGALSTQKTIGRAGRDDWSELLRWVNEGERAKQKVAELNSTVDVLNRANREAIARADAAEDERWWEREEAQRIQNDLRTKLEGTIAELTTERDGLKTALSETKGELARVRESFRDESSTLRLLASELGLTAEEIAKLELEGRLLAFVRAEIKARMEAGRQEESDKSHLLDLYSVLEKSGIMYLEGWREMNAEKQQQRFIDCANVLIVSWLETYPERKAVKALTEERRQVLAKDKSDLEQKHRPTYPRRADLLKRLGEPQDFIESGALGYRDDWDLKLGDDTIDVARFDAFVEKLPRLRLNSKIDSWTKLSKEAHVHKQTLKRYADFVDLTRWLPKANEQSQQEDDGQEE